MNTPEFPAQPLVSLSEFYGASDMPSDPNAQPTTELNVDAVDPYVAWTVRSAFQKSGIVQGEGYADVQPDDQNPGGERADSHDAAFGWTPYRSGA